MPRLTTKQYLRTHRQLRRFWLEDRGLYAELTSTEQWQLHDYFQPSKDLSDEELLAHRERISRERPSLPHQAGRALSKFQASAARVDLARVRQAAAPVRAGGHRRQGERKITVKALVRPEIDVDKLARVLLQVAEDLQQRKRQHLGKVALSELVQAGYQPTNWRLSGEIELILRYPRFNY